MNFKLKYELSDIPTELIMAAYNGVVGELFTYEKFDNKIAVKNFLEVIDKNGDQNIKGKIDRLEARYKKEFKKIMDDYGRNFRNPEYAEKLKACHDHVGDQFKWLIGQYNSHIKFYQNLAEKFEEYLDSGFACFAYDEYTSVVVIKGGVVATYTNNHNQQVEFTKVYDKVLHENALKSILEGTNNSEKDENE